MVGDPPFNCIVPWPTDPIGPWNPLPAAPVQPCVPWIGTLTFTPLAPRLSDEDVERIARRVVELQRKERR